MNWVVRGVLTGYMPELPPKKAQEHVEEFRLLGKDKGREAQVLELEQQQRRYAEVKASALDNSQKNSSVMTNTGLTIAAVVTLAASGKLLVVVMGLIAVGLMMLAIIIANVMVSPKAKNWVKAENNENTQLRSLNSLRTATAKRPKSRSEAAATDEPYDGVDFQLEFHYMEAATGEYKWNRLLMLERREFSLVCQLSNIGILLTLAAIVTAVVTAL